MDKTRRQVTLWLAGSFGLLMSKRLGSSRVHQEQHLVGRKREQADEKDLIRQAITDSQAVETLVIYVSPKNFDHGLLTKYWVPANKGGKAIVQVQNAIRRLLDHGWHYSVDSANEEFDVRSITIYPPGDVADVRTRERWYVPMIDENGNIVRDRDSILEYPAAYRLVKIEGRWLVLSGGVYRDRD